jgi:hypothetical protein
MWVNFLNPVLSSLSPIFPCIYQGQKHLGLLASGVALIDKGLLPLGFEKTDFSFLRVKYSKVYKF